MNYLAHAYLSFNNPGWLTGQLISDFVKGKKRFEYLPQIQQGIALHRAIDEYTDAHWATKEAKEIFRPGYRLYAGAFVDVAYDHFLANDRTYFTDGAALTEFASHSYRALQSLYPVVPLQFHTLFNRMRQQDWLYNYRFHQGIKKSFEGVVWRSKYLTESETAFRLFCENHGTLQASYQEFFPDLLRFATAYAQALPVIERTR